jgi:predicted membrane protein
LVLFYRLKMQHVFYWVESYISYHTFLGLLASWNFHDVILTLHFWSWLLVLVFPLIIYFFTNCGWNTNTVTGTSSYVFWCNFMSGFLILSLTDMHCLTSFICHDLYCHCCTETGISHKKCSQQGRYNLRTETFQLWDIVFNYVMTMDYVQKFLI